MAGSRRPPLAQWFIDFLYLGKDPMSTVPVLPDLPTRAGTQPLTLGVIDFIMAKLLVPLTFWLEVGSYQGDSAVMTAKHLKERHHVNNLSIVCLDPFLGDFQLTPDFDRSTIIGEDGLSKIVRQFVSRVKKEGQGDAIVPFPGVASNVLRTLRAFSEIGYLPQLPQVIYLDASHEYSDTLAEVELAWAALAPGGILFGDDWAWLDLSVDKSQLTAEARQTVDYTKLDWTDTAVQKAVIRWAALREAELDDDLGIEVLRVRRGLFLSRLAWQWFVRKPLNWQPGPAIELVYAWRSKAVSLTNPQEPPWDCFTGDWASEEARCCGQADGGVQGCWDAHFTYEKCCVKKG
eukprot:TRINITY_DN26473_c0_g2_i1.p1 TRINITY_DN26473_c0_g2~~TRINITY_DN26473_c0_g2_i1.p1  ORF type:complete len:367 (-),score=65.47 TRINITY_DN26473_c0_g2_i1:5-1045(-)